MQDAGVDGPAVLPPTPTAESHYQGLSRKQVQGILDQYIESGGWTEWAKDCLGFDENFGRGLYSPALGGVEWWYSSTTDLWNVTATGRSCDGVQRWYVDDDTGEVSDHALP